jgi:hypothetical protein
MTIARVFTVTNLNPGGQNVLTKVVTYADHCRAVEDAVKQERERIIALLDAKTEAYDFDVEGCDSEEFQLYNRMIGELQGIASKLRQEPVAAPQDRLDNLYNPD